jgi:heme ABC exporter ATP-binding subunit CcmA
VTSLIELDSVGVTIGNNPILDAIDLAVAPGDSVAVIGPNGSGKTTLLRVIATLLRPTSGRVVVMGKDTSEGMTANRGRGIGFITHEPGLLAELTLEENLVHFSRLSGEDPSAVTQALYAVGLENVASRRVSEASFGMKRRAEIAWQLIAKPRLVLLDEARSGLDEGARSLIDSLTDLTVSRGGAVVSVSHELPSHGDESPQTVLELSNGRLIPR